MFGADAVHRVTQARARLLPEAVTLGERAVTLGVYRTLDGLAPLWNEIERTGARASVFQSHGWLAAWERTAAREDGEVPLVVTARDCGQKLRLILPLGVTSRTPARLAVAGFLGQGHANYGLPLVDPAVAGSIRAGEIRRLLAAVARGSDLDAASLERQPAHWDGRPNPFAAGGIVSANDSYVLPLEADFAALHARLFSSRTRSTLRRKTRRLAGHRGFRHGPAVEPEQRTRLLDAFLATKGRQLREGGIADIFAAPGLAAFYREILAHRCGTLPPLEIVAIEAEDGIGAIALLIEADGRRYLLNTALGSGPLRDASPGLVLLTGDIERAATRGCHAYDFGPGAAAYKAAWQPEPVPLVTTLVPLSTRGVPLVTAMAAALYVKRTIKRTPLLWSMARALRRGAFGRSPPQED